jgi:type IV secretory pathway ATPase VirB11/archaellum biosynthesis ATPase
MTTPIAQLRYMLEPFMPLLEGGTEDIAINEPHRAWVHRGGKWLAFEMPSLDYDTLVDMTILAASVTDQTSANAIRCCSPRCRCLTAHHCG